MLQGTITNSPLTSRQQAESVLKNLADNSAFGMLNFAARYLYKNLSERTTKAHFEQLIFESSKLIPIESSHQDAALFWQQIEILRRELPESVTSAPPIVQQFSFSLTNRQRGAGPSSEEEEMDADMKTPLLGKSRNKKASK